MNEITPDLDREKGWRHVFEQLDALDARLARVEERAADIDPDEFAEHELVEIRSNLVDLRGDLARVRTFAETAVTR